MRGHSECNKAQPSYSEESVQCTLQSFGQIFQQKALLDDCSRLFQINNRYSALVDHATQLLGCAQNTDTTDYEKGDHHRYPSLVYYAVKLTFDYQVTHLLQAMVNLKFNAYYEKLIRPTCSASLCRGASASRRLRKRRIISDDRFPYQLYPRSMRWLKTGVTWP